MNTQIESHTRLHGRWLFIARLAWVIGFITLTLMYTLGFIAARDAFSTVCKEELCTLRQQIRHTDAGDQVMSWPGPPIGYADRLHQDQVKALERFGLTLDQYGWLAALQLGLPVLVFLLIAAGLFWWKSDDWMVLFVSVMVATIPIANVPLPFILVVRQPAWQWVFDALSVVALSCFLIFPLIFPTGRFVPRWTRWMALFEIAGAVIILVLPNSILEGAKPVVPTYVALSFVTGVYAQLYRYFRVASPVERQQLKWVIVGLAGFISITLLGLLPLNALLVYRATGMDPARALALSVIPDTIFQVILLFIPVSIAISVLRYRLWDIDIIISRTLVYGTLSAGIVVTYILLIGLLGQLLNTHIALAAALLTAALTVSFFQPLRLRLQHAVNRVTFGGRDIPKREVEETHIDSEMPWRQHWPAWLLFDLNCFLSVLSLIFLVLSWATPVQDIYGFRGEAAILALAFGSIGLLLARRHRQNPIGWLLLAAGLVSAIVEFGMEYAAYALLTKPGVLLYGALAAWIASWIWVAAIGMLIYSFLLFPTGHLPSDRWRPVAWLVMGGFVLTTFSFMLRPGPLRFASYLDNPFAVPAVYRALSPLEFVNAGAIFLIGFSLILRLQRAQGIERQQLKWFAYTATLMTIIGMSYSLADAAGIRTDPTFYQYLTVAIWAAISLAIGFAILRYRLWDIDIIINRTLVYGTLSAGIFGTYVLLVGLLGTLLETHVTLAAASVTAALIIPFFQPLRARLQRVANHLTFGGRDVPSPKQEIEESQPDSEISLRPRWIEVVNSVWFMCAMLTATILIGTVPIYYSHITHPIPSDPYDLRQSNIPFQVLVGVSDLLSGFISFALAALLFWRKPNDRLALFVSFFFLYTSIAWNHSFDYFLTAYFGAPSTDQLWSELSNPATILLFCIFPDGRFVPRWTRWLFLFSIMQTFSFLAVPEWRFILGVVGAPQFILATYAQVYRYRRVSSISERQQTKWFVFGLFVSLVLWIIANLIYKKPSPPLLNVTPIFLAIAILRSRLWNIDLIINRALVYGALTAGIIALYVLLVGALSLLSQTTGNLVISLLATGLIAFLFQPLRERLQRGVNRLLYGDRDDPYAALSRLGRRLEASLAPEAVLPTVVTTVRDVLKLPYVAIYLKHEDGNKVAAESASPSLRSENGRIRVPGIERGGLCVPLIHQGETLGYIVLGPRTPNEAFSSTDLRLLDDLVPQVGVAVHAVRLTADLQRSRERLVLTREEERRRLRRDLHDDLAPTLASLGLTASTAADLIETNPTTAKKLVKELQNEIRATVGNIRRLVYDLRPPTLDELGLLAAVRERAVQYSNAPDGFHVTVAAPAQLPALPAAVEVAAYRIVQEALENVSKHSQARTCSIRFANHNGLEIEILDDGIGLPPNITPGVGLRSMRERAEELGGSCVIERGVNGGTCLLARLPIGEFNGAFTRSNRG